MSATYHIFYNSDKEIMWSATAGVDSTIITGQKSNNNYDYVSLTLSETPIGEKYYINSDATGVVERVHLLQLLVLQHQHSTLL